MGESNRGAKKFIDVGQGRYAMADAGEYFTALNPTPGTGIAATIQTSFVGTNGLFRIGNGAPANGKSIYMDYLRLICTVVPTATTRAEIMAAVDLITRYASGGSALTPKNVNSGDSVASVATVNFGALTLNAEGGNVRRLARAQLRTAIPVQFEEFFITFGEPIGGGPLVLNGANAQRNVISLAPMVVGPGHDGIVHAWWTGNTGTAGQWEVEAGWWER